MTGKQGRDDSIKTKPGLSEIAVKCQSYTNSNSKHPGHPRLSLVQSMGTTNT